MPFHRHVVTCGILLGALAFAQAQVPVKRNPQARRQAKVRTSEIPRLILHDDAMARIRAMEERRGGRPSRAYLEEKARILEHEVKKWSAQAPQRRPVGAAALRDVWVNIGPGTLDSGERSPYAADLNSGRLTAIVTHPTNPNILYIASAGGGVWKCTNADVASDGDWVWTPMTDALPISGSEGNVPVGDLAMDPDDPETLYMGLGDPKGAGEAWGFWITHDGGNTWTRGFTNASQPEYYTRRILPLGGGRVLLATPFHGLYRSSDGGITFSRVGPDPDSNSGFNVNALIRFSATDLAVAAYRNDSTLQRPVPAWMYSSDGGVTWSPSTLDASITGVPMNPLVTNLSDGPAGDGVAYGVIGNDATQQFAQGVVRTADRGRSWTFRASTQAYGHPGGDGFQAGYNQLIVMDPANSDRLFIGANAGVVYRSMDGGNSWIMVTEGVAGSRVYAHPDLHVGTFSKTGPATLYIGSDGGLSVFRDPYRLNIPRDSDPTFVDNRRNKGLTDHLLWAIASTTATNLPGASNFVLVGMQDTSTGMRLTPMPEFRTTPTTGDGVGVLIHRTDATKAFAVGVYSSFYSSTDFGGPNPTWNLFQVSNGSIYSYATGIPTNPDGILVGSARTVYRSVDFGQTFTALPTSNLSTLFLLFKPAASFHDPELYAVTAATTDGSPGYITRDGGSTWTPLGRLPTASAGSPFAVSFSPWDPNMLYLTTLGLNTRLSHVFKSTDLGATWTSIDRANGYPFGIPANVIRESEVLPGTLYVGTDIGVYTSPDGGATWSRMGTGQPYVRVEDLYVAPDGRFLRSATYGRGAWEVRLTDAQGPVIRQQPSSQGVLVGASATFMVDATGDAPLSYQWARDGASIPGETSASLLIPGVTLQDEGASFTVTVSGPNGSVQSTPAVLHVLLGPVTVQASLGDAGLLPGRQATFTATVSGAVNGAVVWTASGGNLAPSANSAAFSASTPGDYTIRAASVADPNQSAVITVRVHGANYANPAGAIAGVDALTLIGKLGTADPMIDLNGDGLVDSNDLDLLLTLLGW